MTKALYLLVIVSIMANLGYYAWGTHEPQNLAVGLFCIFVALFADPRKS